MKPRFLLCTLLLSSCSFFGSRTPVPNPDPNHTHMDFAVWAGGTKLDFSADEYMSSVPKDDDLSTFLPRVLAHGDEEEGDTLPGRKYLHLHDGNGHVIHSHKPNQTIGQFFASIGLSMTTDCLTLDDHQFDALDPGWKKDFAREKALCNNGKFHWTFYVNGKVEPMNPEYVLRDIDKLLLIYSAGDIHTTELESMTDDACLYSKTCPWRGEPPAENCISDPEVPCVLP